MPNSLLWIGLVVMWIFVLFPMLADRHPRIRQTTDAALATRVLHRGGSKRRSSRGPASGHDSDPNWRPSARPERMQSRGIDAEDLMETHAEEPAETEELDDREVGEAPSAEPAEEFVAEHAEDAEDHGVAAEAAPRGDIPVRRGRGGFDPEADAIARAARYSFRQRAVLGLVLAAVFFAALALVVSSTLWWLSALSVVGTVAYLSYLRRQVRMEEEIRRRRMARLARSRRAVDLGMDGERELVPSRLRRAGAVVLESDDEDPAFEHLPHYEAATARRSVEEQVEIQMHTAAG